jgi:hypothetical protein
VEKHDAEGHGLNLVDKLTTYAPMTPRYLVIITPQVSRMTMSVEFLKQFPAGSVYDVVLPIFNCQVEIGAVFQLPVF